MPDRSPVPSQTRAPAPEAPESLLVCPECQAAVAPRLFETHLRRVHHVYQFRGERRARAVEGLAPLVAGHGSTPLLVTLASDNELAARHLALLAIARLPTPLDPNLVQPLRALLLDRRLPPEAQQEALANAVRSAGPNSLLTAELLQKLVSGVGKARAIERLRQLEKVTGPLPAIDALCAQLEENLRMSCPRCPAELRRPQMIQHLWDEHRLVLDGRRVRQPWAG